MLWCFCSGWACMYCITCSMQCIDVKISQSVYQTGSVFVVVPGSPWDWKSAIHKTLNSVFCFRLRYSINRKSFPVRVKMCCTDVGMSRFNTVFRLKPGCLHKHSTLEVFRARIPCSARLCPFFIHHISDKDLNGHLFVSMMAQTLVNGQRE